MPIGYKDRTDQFGRIIDTAAKRARQDTALAEEGVSRGMIGSIQAVGQIPANVLSGYQKGRQFAEESGERQAKIQQASTQAKVGEAELAAQQELAKTPYTSKAAPGEKLSMAQAKAIIPLRVSEENARSQAGARSMQLQSAADRKKYQDRLLDLKEQLAAQRGVGGQGKPMSPTDLEKFGQGRDAINTLSSLEKTLSSSGDIMGPVAGRLSAANPYNTKATIVNSEIKAAAQTIGRYLEGGMLRAEDIPKYEAMLPNIKDTPEGAAGKKEVVRAMILRKNAADVAALQEQGYNVAGVAAKQTATEPKEKQPSGTAYAAPVTTHTDDEARSWADAHPNDKRAVEILKRLGVQ